MKHPITKKHVPHRIRRDHPTVVRIRHINAPKNLPAAVRLAVAISVLHQPQLRLLRNQHPRLRERHPIQRIQPLRKSRAAVRLTIVVRILQNNDFILRRQARHGVRKRRHRHRPQPSPRIKGNLHRIAQVGKLHLGGKQVHRIALRHLEFRLLFQRRPDHPRIPPVVPPRNRRQRRQPRHRHHAPTRIRRQAVHLGLRRRNHLIVARNLRRIFLRALAHPIVKISIFRPHHLRHIISLGRHRLGHLPHPRVVLPRQRPLPNPFPRNHPGHHMVAQGVEVQPIVS